jgi:hypothetical protein
MNISSFPTAVDVTLHRYNHLDNRLWTQIRNQLDYVEIDEMSVVVTLSQLASLLDNNYMPMINRIKSTGVDSLHKQVNSPYFIYMMCVDMENLQLIKLTMSHDKKFSRLIENDGMKILKFDFRILSMTIKLHDIFEIEDLAVINPILESLGILEEDVPYSRLPIVEILDLLDNWVELEMDNDLIEGEPDAVPLITTILDLIDIKVEGDNPLTLLVTDY